MKTIKERAEEYSAIESEQKAYLQGALEQQEIDNSAWARERYLEEIVELRTARYKQTMKQYLDSREQYIKHLKQQWLEHSIKILRKLTEKHIVEQYKQTINHVDSEK